MQPQIRCAESTLHGLFFKHSGVSQASQASCFASPACVIRTHRHSSLSPHDVRTVSRKLLWLVKMSPDSLSSYQFACFFFTTPHILCSAYACTLTSVLKSLSFSIIFSRKCIPKLRKVSSLFIQGLFQLTGRSVWALSLYPVFTLFIPALERWTASTFDVWADKYLTDYFL